ncbi:hypothetical protein BOX15_Mlig003330g2, partial [Macrostomum lignano]
SAWVMSADLAETGVLPAGEDPANASMKPPPKRRVKKKPLPAAATAAADGTADLSAMPMPAASAGEAPPKPRQKKKRRDPSAGAGAATIDSLRSSLEKDRQDPLIELNTYDPSRSPKKDVKGGGTANQGFVHDDDETAGGGALSPTRKPRKKRQPTAAPAPGTQENPSSEPAIAAETAAAPLESSQPAAAAVKPKRKVRKPKAAATAEAEPEVDGAAADAAPAAAVSVEDETADGAPAKRRLRKKKQPRQQQPEQEQQQQAEEGATDEAGGVITEQPQPVGDATAATDAAAASTSRRFDAAGIADEGLIVRLRVHRTDQLKNDTHIRHPRVRVHVVDTQAGRYLAKQHPDRKVTSFYESVSFLLPVMTGECDFRRQGNTLPVWEEQLLLDENFAYIAQNPNVLFLFEVLDMLSVAAIQNNRINSPEAGWYRVAWAFLRPHSASGRSHCGRKVRLQLFEALPLRESEQTDPEVPYLFHWYQSRARIPYPSTLYVTVEEFSPNRNNEQVAGRTRSQFPFEQEGLGLAGVDVEDGEDEDEAAQRRNRHQPDYFQRVPGQLCKIPNKAARTLPTGTHGCSALRFSPDGRWLAAACRNPPVDYPLVLYSYTAAGELGGAGALAGKPEFNLLGHAGIVYDLGWSRKSHLLVSASGDCSARVWQIGTKQAGLHKQLVHPTFVYCAQFHPQSSSLVATGCYDRIIRVWSIFESACEVVWQLEPHRSHVNALVFEPEGRYVYSGDASGQLGVWKCPYTAGTDRPGVAGEWTRSSWMDLPELKDKCITCMSLHPSATRLLVQTRDSTLRLVHVRGSQRGYVVMDYLGHANSRENLRSCVSPCGAFVITGSEDGDVYVFNADSGDVVATYRQVNLSGSVSCLDYHPLDNALAFSSLSHSAAILIYQYDASLARRDGQQAQLGRSGTLVNVGDTVQQLEASRLIQSGPVLQEVDRLKTMQRSHAGAEMGGLKKSRMAQDRLDSVLAGGSMRRSVAASTGTMPQVASLLPGAMDSTTPRHLQQPSTEIGRHGQLDAGKPRLTLLLDGANRASFKIDRAGQKRTAAAEEQQAATQAPTEIVIAILDYKASRSDEISFFKGQRIRVIHKDSQSWWLGELESPLPAQEESGNTQGYFPTSYVVNERASRTPSLQGDEASPRNGGSASRHIRRLSKDGGALPPQAGRPAAKVKTTRFDDTPIGQSTA